MALILRAPTLKDCEIAREWRNTEDARLGLRTSHLLTEEMQAEFYRTVICDRRAPHRFWAVVGSVRSPDPVDMSIYRTLVAFGGLTDIQWENGWAEISLIVSPDAQGRGVGGEAVDLILKEAFERMRLLTVGGECYEHNPAVTFWEKMVKLHCGGSVYVPGRKWWDGRLYGSMMFWFWADACQESAPSQKG